jgi:hypothetical protein
MRRLPGAIAVIVVVLVLGGGAAVAAFVVSSNAQIGPNTVSGSKRPSGYPNDNIANGSVDTPDLTPSARVHRMEWTSVADAPGSVITTLDNVRFSARCVTSAPFVGIYLYATNLSGQLGTLNSFLTEQHQAGDGPAFDTSGEYVGAGQTHTVDRDDANDNFVMIFGVDAVNFGRTQGRVVFQTPGRVTTVIFHAFVTKSCQLFGTARSSAQT